MMTMLLTLALLAQGGTRQELRQATSAPPFNGFVPVVTFMEQRDVRTDRAIPEGAQTENESMRFVVKAVAPKGRIGTIEVEVRALHERFTGTSSISSWTRDGQNNLIADVPVRPGAYRWRVRAITHDGIASEWRAFGGPKVDFRIVSPSATAVATTGFAAEMIRVVEREMLQEYYLAAMAVGGGRSLRPMMTRLEELRYFAQLCRGDIAYVARMEPKWVERALMARILNLRMELLRTRSRKDLLRRIERHQAWLRSVKAGNVASVVEEILREERSAR